MASTIPRSYRKEVTDALEAEALYVALFTDSLSTWNATSLAQDTYAELLTAGFTESTASTSGYTAGGVSIPVTSANIGATNATNINADDDTELTISGTLSAAYAVIYNHTNGKIRAVIDLGGTKTVTDGKMTITWDATNGLIKIS